MLDKLQSADFTPLLHQTFQVRLDGLAPLDLELAEVNELGAAPTPDLRKPFSLLFLGPVSDQYLLQGTYPLTHAQLGTLEVFLVPLGPQARRMRYEALFT